MVEAEKRMGARLASKRCLGFLKRDTLKFLVDGGTLRSMFETDLHSVIIPGILQNAGTHEAQVIVQSKLVNEAIYEAGCHRSKKHRSSIVTELKRRDNAVIAAKRALINA